MELCRTASKEAVKALLSAPSFHPRKRQARFDSQPVFCERLSLSIQVIGVVSKTVFSAFL